MFDMPLLARDRVRFIGEKSPRALGPHAGARRDGDARPHDTDLAVLGKIGEFGQPIVRKKADTLLEEFARHLRSVLVTRGSEGHVPPPSAATHG